jgi:hypothetical protein
MPEQQTTGDDHEGLPTKWRPLNTSERADAEDSNRRLLQRRESKKGDKQAQMSGNEDADPKKERTHWHFETPGDRPSVHASTGEDLITRSSLGNSPAKLISQMLCPSRDRAVLAAQGDCAWSKAILLASLPRHWSWQHLP